MTSNNCHNLIKKQKMGCTAKLPEKKLFLRQRHKTACLQYVKHSWKSSGVIRPKFNSLEKSRQRKWWKVHHGGSLGFWSCVSYSGIQNLVTFDEFRMQCTNIGVQSAFISLKAANWTFDKHSKPSQWFQQKKVSVQDKNLWTNFFVVMFIGCIIYI